MQKPECIIAEKENAEFDPREEKFGEILHGSVAHNGNTPGRNDPCPCGSGKKYKKCCLGKSVFAE